MQKKVTIRPFLWLVFLGLLAWYFWQAAIFFQGALPFHAFDEYEYFLYARSFAQTGLLKTPFLEQDAQSLAGQFGTHGFAYVLLHGTINRLFGEHWSNIPLFNLLIVIAALTLTFLHKKSRFSFDRKITFLSLILSSFLVAIYSFSFMQESIHLSTAIAAVFLLYDCYHGTDSRRSVFWYILLILSAALFRITWVFWLWALLPKFWHRRRRFILLNLALFILALLYMRLTHAPYVMGFPYNLSKKITQEGIGIGVLYFINHFSENIYTYFRWYIKLPFYFFAKYFIFCFGLYLLLRIRRLKNTFGTALSLLWILYTLLLFSLHDTVYWRDVRLLAPVLIAMYFWFAFLASRRAAYVLLGIQLFLLPWLHTYTTDWIDKHRKTYLKNEQFSATEAKYFQKLRTLINKPSESVVLLKRDFATHGAVHLNQLPFLSAKNHFIRYAVYYAPIETAPKPLHDYLMLPKTLAPCPENLRLLEKNKHYVLYKVIRKPPPHTPENKL